MQIDMFALDEAPVLFEAVAVIEPAPVAVEYAPVEPYEPRPEGGAALEAWTARLQRGNLVYLVGAICRATACREFFNGYAREVLAKLDGLVGEW